MLSLQYRRLLPALVWAAAAGACSESSSSGLGGVAGTEQDAAAGSTAGRGPEDPVKAGEPGDARPDRGRDTAAPWDNMVVDGKAEAGRADAEPNVMRDASSRVDGAGPTGTHACTDDDDCFLVNDCCHCMALNLQEKAPSCDPQISCLVSTCAQYSGIDRARCVAGRCILGIDCNTKNVICERPSPVCAPGHTPRITQRCYGECVDSRQCALVPGCDVCAKGDKCVADDPSRGPFHCVQQ